MITITKNKQYKGCPDGLFEETINETIVGNNDDRIFELEKQLHEQYAVNNNSNAGILISLISALLISFTGYGYVLYQYSIGECAIGIVNIAAVAVMFVMVLLYCISVNLGTGQRMEQFITFGIRVEHYKCKIERYKNIFPNGYTPFSKKYEDFVQGLYNIWTKVALFTIVGIGFCDVLINWNAEIIPTIIQAAICIAVCLLYRGYKFRTYLDREKERKDTYEDFLLMLKEENVKREKSWLIENVKCILLLMSIFAFANFFFVGKKIFIKQENTQKIDLNTSEPVKIQIID